MQDGELKDILFRCKTVAVVGISPKPDRPSHRVAAYLQSQGFRIVPVRPDGETILGEKVYPSLSDIPKEIKVDIADLFRKSEEVPPVVEEAIRRGVQVIWMQEGVSHPEACRRAQEAGLQVVMDRCIKKDHQRLFENRKWYF